MVIAPHRNSPLVVKYSGMDLGISEYKTKLMGGGDRYGSTKLSYCQMLCMALGGDPFFNNTIDEFYTSYYFSKPLRMM